MRSRISSSPRDSKRPNRKLPWRAPDRRLQLPLMPWDTLYLAFNVWMNPTIFATPWSSSGAPILWLFLWVMAKNTVKCTGSENIMVHLHRYYSMDLTLRFLAFSKSKNDHERLMFWLIQDIRKVMTVQLDTHKTGLL